MIMSAMKNNFLSNQKRHLQTCRSNLESFKKKFAILGEIEEGTKIGKNYESVDVSGTEFKIDGDYCLYRSGFFQKWSRWWFDENHKKTFKYLDDDFTLFTRYLDHLKNMSQIDGKILYKKLFSETIQLINNIVKGLYNLKQTYSNVENLKAKIESIILVLLDFKNENEKEN